MLRGNRACRTCYEDATRMSRKCSRKLLPWNLALSGSTACCRPSGPGLQCVVSVQRYSHCSVKLAFHGADTDTDTDTDTDILARFRARIVARMSACPANSPFCLLRPGHARRSSPTCPPTCPTRALFLAMIVARMSVRDARVYTCQRVLYTIRYRVHVYKITLMSVSVSVSV